MKKQEGRVSRRWRTAAVLALGVAIGAVLVATPAASHIGTVTHLWNKHIKPRADKRYLNLNEVRAFGNVSDADQDDFTATSMTSVISKTFTVPRNGFLFINGSISAADDLSLAGNGQLWFSLRLDGTAVSDDPFPYDLEYGGESGTGDTGAASAVVPVTAGTHTVHLDARDDGAGSFIYHKDISVLYVRSGSGVTIPARPTSARATSPQ
jgi:hypothetical protein